MRALGAFPLLAICALAVAQDDPFAGATIRQDLLLNRDGSPPRMMVRQPQAPLPIPKKGPKEFGPDKIKFDFDWLTWGFVGDLDKKAMIRFRVYSQERKTENDTSVAVCRMLLRLWDMNFRRLKIDHGTAYWYQMVNVYLTYGGKPGGEQFVAGDIEGKNQVRANNIFFYDLPSFAGALEMAREVAHEYGHATLPPVGPFRDPEDWANGSLGEKLYLSWIRDLLAKKLLEPDDFMGVTKEQLDPWLAANVDPLVDSAAARQPTMALLADRSAKGMDNYLGLTLYMSQILPDAVFGRSVRMTTQDPREYLQAIKMSVEEKDELQLTVPERLRGKPVWVPIANGAVSGAKVLKIDGGWAQIQAGAAPVTVKQKSR